MTRRIGSPYTIGLAAAMSVGMAATAAAQGTTTSQTRIPITKETSPGEVAPATTAPKVDTVTVTVYRTDTTRVYLTDTLRMNVYVAGPTTVRVDTVSVSVAKPDSSYIPIQAGLRIVGPQGVYFGVGAGTALPHGSLVDVNDAAGAVQAQAGWQNEHSPVGFRLDVNYDRYSGASGYSQLGPDPDMLNTSLDLTLKVPYLNHLWGMAPRFSVYALGGGTWSNYHNLRSKLDDGFVGVGNPNVATINSTWNNQIGWNAGGGVAYQWRSTAIFAEARVISFRSANSPTARQVPIVLGLNWY